MHRPLTRFDRPDELAASQPPEARGLARDEVRLLVASQATSPPTRIDHVRFRDLRRFLNPGDLLVVNTSATRPAAVAGSGPGDRPVVIHFSTALDDGSWVLEVRAAAPADGPLRALPVGTRIDLPDGLQLVLRAPYPPEQGPAGARLWRSQVIEPERLAALLARHGQPIRYGYVPVEWPLHLYQTVFVGPEIAGLEWSSAEMASAGRPFSHRMVTELVSQGMVFAPIELHAGVASQEPGEPPAAERFQVPARTAALVNWTRRHGGRVVAVGTTVTRALESAAQADGTVAAAHGWTELVLGPDRPARVVNGLITGLHDPEASHLLLLEAVAGAALVQQAYDAALERGYLWHEFGDSCLLLP